MRPGSGFVGRVEFLCRGGLRVDHDLGFWVNILAVGVADYGSALTAGHLFQTPECRPSKKVTQNACSYVRPSQARVPSLRDRSGRSGSGLLRCTSFRCVWLRQTVAALPRPDQSLHSAFRRRRWIKIKSRRADTRPLSGEKRGCSAFDLCCCCPSPQPSPEGEGADFGRSKICIRLGIASRRISPKHLGQSPLPPGEG
jgi:hypothetical protein